MTIDYLPPAEEKIYLTAAAAFRAGVGHDMLSLANWPFAAPYALTAPAVRPCTRCFSRHM